MIDLRLRKQNYKGFYIEKNAGYYSVGKNGTSIHRNFYKKEYPTIDDLRFVIIQFIREFQ